MPQLNDILPPLQSVLDMEPEEFAPFVLRLLATFPEHSLNRYNFTLSTNPDYAAYAGHASLEQFCFRLMEAWMWLEKEQFIAPKPGTQDDWAFITRRGKKVLEGQDFSAYKKGLLLPSENLDPILVAAVKPLFLRGDYETAVFRALKEVEMRVRKKSGSSHSDFGVPLMRKAFNPATGTLTDETATEGEKVAVMDLFAGAIGAFKNPSSHREVEFSDPNDAADVIHLANLLLKRIG